MKLVAIQHKTTRRPLNVTAAANDFDAWVRFLTMEGNAGLLNKCVELAKMRGFEIVEIDTEKGTTRTAAQGSWRQTQKVVIR